MKGVKLNIFWGNLKPVVGKLELNFWQKKNGTLYIIQCFYQALKYSIVYINENCQTVIIFNNLGIQTLVGTWGKNCIFLWQRAGNVHSIIWMGFWKTIQTSGLYNYQLEKLIACLYDPVREGKRKITIK